MGISRIAVFKKVKKGQLEAFRVGRNWAIPAAALENRERPAPPAPVPPPRPALNMKGSPPPRAPVPDNPPPQTDPMDDMGWD